jgi:hypothetical protein
MPIQKRRIKVYCDFYYYYNYHHHHHHHHHQHVCEYDVHLSTILTPYLGAEAWVQTIAKRLAISIQVFS